MSSSIRPTFPSSTTGGKNDRRGAVTNIKPGYVGFAHSHGVMARLIRIGTDGEWNHQFVISDEVDTDGHPLIIQATFEGVTGDARLDSVSPGGHYCVVRPPSFVRLDDVVRFAKSQVGDPYGVGTDVSIAMDIVTPPWFPSFRSSSKSSWECAAVANESLRFGGWYHNWPDIYHLTPQQGYDALMADGGVVESTV